MALGSGKDRAETPEEESARRYRDLVEMSPDAIFVAEDGVTRFANPAALALLGSRGDDDVVGQPITALFAAGGAGGYPQGFDELLREPGTTAWDEAILRGRDGGEVPIEMRALSYRDADRLIVQMVCRDIAPHNRLREQRDFADAILTSIPGTFYHFDDQLRLLGWNRNFEEINGYSAEELAAMQPLDFFPEEYRGVIAEKVAEVFEKGEAQVEAESVTKEGRRIPFLVTAARFEHRGRPHFVGVGIDITERKRIEAEWRDSLARFHAVARATGDVVWDWDLVTDEIWWNDNFQYQFGYGAGDIEATIESWTGRLHPEDHDGVIARIHAAIDSGRDAWSDEYRFLRNDGGYAEIFDRGHVLRDASGRAVRMVGAMQDITQRKATEYALREKSALLEAVVESAGTGIVVVGPDGQKLIHNRMLYELLRIPPEIASDSRVAPQFEFAVTQAKNPAVWISMATSLASRLKAVERFELELIDGRILDTYTGPVRDREGRRYGRAWIFEDVTEQRRRERQQRQVAKVEAIGNFAAGIAHDLGNMLLPIVLNAEQIIRGAGNLPNRGQIILSAAAQANDLTRQILDFAGERRQIREPIDVCAPMQQAIDLLAHTMPEAIVVERSFPAEPAMIVGNATQIMRLALNLCKNAIQAMNGTGNEAGSEAGSYTPRRLVVRVDEGEVDHAFAQAHAPLPAGPVVILSVEDSGPGMDAATIERIFEPFFSTKGAEGTGLGLALVQSIVAQHDGAITVDSVPGRGTCFRIWLPATSAAMVDGTEPVSALASGPKNILVVDDRPELGKSLVDLLRGFGYTAEAIEDPLVARDRLVMLPGRFDLLITDYQMPGMNGAELVAGIRFACPDLPCILTSGMMPPIDPDLAAAFVGFLPKPFTRKELREVCAAVFEGGWPVGA
jgi:PAS domain S-box-containing protein